MSTISAAAAAARESARHSDGRFGEQAKDDPGDLALAGDPSITTMYSTLDRGERLDAIKTDLVAAVDQIVKSGRLAEWLERLALRNSVNGMNKWSFRNRLLAYLQTQERRSHLSEAELAGLPAEPLVMTAKQWMDRFNRHPKRGTNAIWILAPSKRWLEVDDPDHPGDTVRRPVVVGFREQAEFDVSQTDGDPLPDFEPPMQFADGHVDDDVLPHLRGKVAELGFTLEERPIERTLSASGTLGYTTSDGSKRVVVDSRLPAAQKASVLAHELAHIRCGHVDGDYEEYRKHRGRMETEAEMTAYMTAVQMGLPREDSTAFSAFYIANWSNGDAGVVEQVFGRASSASLSLLEGFRNPE